MFVDHVWLTNVYPRVTQASLCTRAGCLDGLTPAHNYTCRCHIQLLHITWSHDHSMFTADKSWHRTFSEIILGVTDYLGQFIDRVKPVVFWGCLGPK